MEITYLQRNEINTQQWDACVGSNINTASLSGMSWYLDSCCKQWDAIIINNYQSVIPLPYRKKFGIRYVYPPFFAPRLGVMGKEITASTWDDVLTCIGKKFKWTDMILPPQTPIHTDNYPCFKNRTYVLDLRHPYDLLCQRYSSNHRRNCKKAMENQLTFVENADIDTIISLFVDNMGKTKEVGYAKKDYNELKNLIAFLQTKDAVEVLGVADKNGKLCAGAFFTHQFGKYNFLFSGREKTNKEDRSMFFLIDNFINNHANNAYDLNFNGSNNDLIARFYAGFGAEESYSCQLYLNNLNSVERNIFAALRKIKS